MQPDENKPASTCLPEKKKKQRRDVTRGGDGLFLRHRMKPHATKVVVDGMPWNDE